MPREVKFRIGRNGEVSTEFSGFPGEDCVAEAERLQRLLAGFGLKLGLTDLALKTPEAISAELGQEEKRKAGAKQR